MSSFSALSHLQVHTPIPAGTANRLFTSLLHVSANLSKKSAAPTAHADTIQRAVAHEIKPREQFLRQQSLDFERQKVEARLSAAVI